MNDLKRNTQRVVMPFRGGLLSGLIGGCQAYSGLFRDKSNAEGRIMNEKWPITVHPFYALFSFAKIRAIRVGFKFGSAKANFCYLHNQRTHLTLSCAVVCR